MAGQPIRQAQELYLTTHEVEVFQARADGASWRKVAKQFNTSTHVLGLWIKGNEQRQAAWKALEEIAAESRAGDAVEILDDAALDARCGITSPELTRLAIARSEIAKWEAGIMARGRFGAEKANAANVIVNVAMLHLTATREVNLNPPTAPTALIGEADYEIVEEPDLESLLYG